MTDSEEDLIETMLESAIAGVNGICDSFVEPDDDFQPSMFVLNEERHELNIVLLPGELFGHDRGKVILTEVMIPAMAVAMGADGLCMVTSAWAVDVDVTEESDEEGQRRLHETHEGRIEIISVIAVTREESAMTYADIIRSPDGPPTVEWRDRARDANEDDAVVDGLFPQAMRAALKHVDLGRS